VSFVFHHAPVTRCNRIRQHWQSVTPKGYSTTNCYSAKSRRLGAIQTAAPRLAEGRSSQPRRVIAAALQRRPPEWKRRRGRPATFFWLRTVENNIKPLNLTKTELCLAHSIHSLAISKGRNRTDYILHAKMHNGVKQSVLLRPSEYASE